MALAGTVLSLNAIAGGNDASNKYASHLKNTFANAQFISWKTTDKYVEASFSQNGELVSAFYNLEGDFIGTKKNVAQETLPMKVKGALQNMYGNYTVTELAEFVDADNDWNYFAAVHNAKESRIIKINPYGDITTMKRTKIK